MGINVQTKTRGARIKKRFTSHAWFTFMGDPFGVMAYVNQACEVE